MRTSFTIYPFFFLGTGTRSTTKPITRPSATITCSHHDLRLLAVVGSSNGRFSASLIHSLHDVRVLPVDPEPTEHREQELASSKSPPPCCWWWCSSRWQYSCRHTSGGPSLQHALCGVPTFGNTHYPSPTLCVEPHHRLQAPLAAHSRAAPGTTPCSGRCSENNTGTGTCTHTHQFPYPC